VTPRITVRQGDITSFEGDAIVNAANNHLVLGAGVAGAIRRAGGPAIQAECDCLGPIRVGEAAITGAGNLHVRWVIHAAAMGDEPVSEGSVYDSTRASLALAARNGVRRIAFPVLGSGIGGYAFGEAASTMRRAIEESPDLETIDEIVFYGFLPQHAAELERIMG
jgi:O-acetyl-ADP-ribose deacetylase (regulator of RNase III)